MSNKASPAILGHVLATLCLTTTSFAQVAVLGGSTSPAWNNDVQAKIQGSALNLGSVTLINASQVTPTLAQLQAFRAVLVFSDTSSFNNATLLGNNLHDYVDSGGGVVVSSFGTSSVFGLKGTWLTQQYGSMSVGSLFLGTIPLQLGTRHVPGHFLFTGTPVVSFDGGTMSGHCTGTLAPNSTRLADWTNGRLFAAERNGLAGREIDLNFYPPSSDVAPDLWASSTDGANLMANALAYVGHFDCPTPAAYCVAKFNSIGCLPVIGASGFPSVTLPWSFLISGSNVRNQKPGLLLYGFNGRANTAFQGGVLCLVPPIRRSISVSSGGNPLPANDCSGVYQLDMNLFARGLLGGTPQPGLLAVGTTVNCQWWGRDSGFPAPNNSTLTEGLEYQVCP